MPRGRPSKRHLDLDGNWIWRRPRGPWRQPRPRPQVQRPHAKWTPGRNGWSWSLVYCWWSRKCPHCHLVRWVGKSPRLAWHRTGIPGRTFSRSIRLAEYKPRPGDPTEIIRAALNWSQVVPELPTLGNKPIKRCVCPDRRKMPWAAPPDSLGKSAASNQSICS